MIERTPSFGRALPLSKYRFEFTALSTSSCNVVQAPRAQGRSREHSNTLVVPQSGPETALLKCISNLVYSFLNDYLKYSSLSRSILTRSTHKKCWKMVLFIVTSQCNQILRMKINVYTKFQSFLLSIIMNYYALNQRIGFLQKIGLSTFEQWSLPNSWKEFARFFSKKAKKMRFRNEIYMSAASSVNWNMRIHFSP